MFYSCVVSPVTWTWIRWRPSALSWSENAAFVRKCRVIHKKSTCVCLRLSVAAFTRKHREARFDLWPALRSCRWAFVRKERNFHCDVHATTENKHKLPPFGSLDSFWTMRSQRSRCRDKGLWCNITSIVGRCRAMQTNGRSDYLNSWLPKVPTANRCLQWRGVSHKFTTGL